MAEASARSNLEASDDANEIAQVAKEEPQLHQLEQSATQPKPGQEVSTNAASANNNNTIASEEDYIDYEDSDDDDDDSKSNHSTSNQNLNPNLSNGSVRKSSNKTKGQSHKDEDKRAHHNVLERKRRDHLKDSFSQLRDSVPTFRSERASRTEILVQAADFIISRVQKNSLMQKELDALVRENRQLEELNRSKQSEQCVRSPSDLVIKTEGPSS